MKTRIRFFDVIFLLVFAACVAGAFAFAGRKKSAGADLVVKTPEGRFLYPLNRNAELDFEGVIGHTKVTIKDGQAWVTESACDNKNCIFMGKLSRPGDFAACLPNAVILTVEGPDEEFDAIVE
ncbi:MAG: NusG domain II-containing protein [Treponema sp.]|nr:NusG domain II-containing protein [Treponema sp.]